MDNIVGIILNGGKSSRMGKDKSGLVYQGHSLLEHAKNLFSEAGVNNIYVSGNGGIEDIIANRGPLGGIYSVMQHLPDNQEIIIAPVDMPLLSEKLLQILLVKESLSEAIHFKKHIMPLKLKLSLNVKKQIEDTIFDESKSLSIKSMLDNLNIDIMGIPPEYAQCFANVNTQDDFNKIMNCTESAAGGH